VSLVEAKVNRQSTAPRFQYKSFSEERSQQNWLLAVSRSAGCIRAKYA